MDLLAQHRFPNGRPHLLDQYGKPLPTDPYTGKIISDGRSSASGMSLPHIATFVATYGTGWNTYLHDRFDEALRHAREDAEVMRRDAYLMALLQERKLAVSGLPWHLEVPDDTDPYQRRVRDGMTQILRSIPELRNIIRWLLEALWYGRYGVQVKWKWGTFSDRPEEEEEDAPPMMPGMPPPPEKKAKGVKKRCFTIEQAWPVNGDKLGWQFDNTPYILVAGDQDQIAPDVEPISTNLARAIPLRGVWRERFLLHRHLQEDADFFAPEQASAVHGVGIRSKLFWLNWLKLEWLGNITDFFDRVGLGFTMWRYPAGNEQARQQAEAAARGQSSRAHVLVPVWGEAGREALTGVERVEVPTSGSEALSKMIDYIDRQLERYVVGQSGSSRSQASGIGNEAASTFMMETKGAITADDAHSLGISMTGTDLNPGIVSIIKKYTFPDAEFPVTFNFGVEKPESEKKVQSGKMLVDMGIGVREDEFRSAAGFEKPSEGDKLVQPPQQGGMGAPGGMPGMPPGGDPMAAMGGGGGAPQGDFLEALKLSRRGEPLRYGVTASSVRRGRENWQNRGLVRVSETGLPLYRWYDPISRQSRVQHIAPGERRAGVTVKGAGKAAGGQGVLDVGRATRSKIAQALALMFPGGWVRPSGLPALAGVESGRPLPADVSRHEDGSLVIGMRAPGGECELALRPDGAVEMTLPSKERFDRAANALAVAGVDVAVFGDEESDLTAAEVPDEVREANEMRRHYRLDTADELMEAADAIEPVPSSADEDAPPESTPETPAPSKFAALAETVKYLESTGRAEAARATAIAYARRLPGGGQ